MRITSKGQVTIPQEIREKAGLLPHTEVEFEYRDGEVVLKPAKPALSPGWEAIRKTAGTANNPVFKGWSTDEIIKFLRGAD
jgi:AbrB family looped-hinge helix DNA binding protein